MVAQLKLRLNKPQYKIPHKSARLDRVFFRDLAKNIKISYLVDQMTR